MTLFWNNFHQVQYSQRHSMINHCDRRITHLAGITFIRYSTVKDIVW